MVEGVLITGGYGALTSTELFLPHTGKTCSLQSLPDRREWHSLTVLSNQAILCGGGSGSFRTSCLQFLPNSSTGTWVNYASLAQSRYSHTAHVFQDKVLLLGGDDSPGTAEIIGSDTRYNLHQDTSDACSIPDESSTILTGGYNSGSGSLKTVARYNMQGFVENLPDLTKARKLHGCGYYINKWNTKVLVVVGGYGGGDTTELLPTGASAWHYGESLPKAMTHLSSVNMGSYSPPQWWI